MSEWCKEYINLSMKSNAVQRECTKIWSRIILLEENKKTKAHNKISSIERVGVAYDDNEVKTEIFKRILKLQEYCNVIRETLNAIYCLTNNHNEENDISASSNKEVSMGKKMSTEKLKKKCKTAVNMYEKKYDFLRDQCNCEIQRLESEIIKMNECLKKSESFHLCFS